MKITNFIRIHFVDQKVRTTGRKDLTYLEAYLTYSEFSRYCIYMYIYIYILELGETHQV